jgi:hypothetical protein
MEWLSPVLLGTQWARAAKDLGVAIVVPYTLEASQAESYEFACLLPNFGAPNGMLLRTTHDKAASLAAAANGFGVSEMYAETRLEYDVASYIECLCDWGWVSTDPPPEWYLAAVRSNKSLERTREG